MAIESVQLPLAPWQKEDYADSLAFPLVSGARCLRRSVGARGAHDLLDHLICSRQQRWRDREADGLRGFGIDHQLERGGLLHGQVGGLRPLEDLVDVGRYPLNHGQQAWSIGDEATRVRELS